ncbi:MAG: plastocyanin/azurin family copper-binding protein [Patescibacteria group bacterium]
MAEEQDMQAPAEGVPAEEQGGGKTKIAAAAAVIIIILAGVAVYAQRGGFGGLEQADEEPAEVIETFGEGAAADAMEEGAMMEGEAGAGTTVGGGIELDAPQGQAQEFDVTGKNFEFSLKEIRVKKGDTVRVNFTSAGGTHNWMVHEFDATTETVSEGGMSAVVFVADKVGEFEYHCMVGSHSQLGMVGTLIVEE